MPAAEQVERALGADLSRAFSSLEPPPSPPPLSPALDLDAEVLPPLDDFSSVEEALSGTLDLAALELPLSAALSPRIGAVPSDSSVSSRSFPSPEHEPHPPPACCPNVQAALNEVSARLKAASSENAALRSRVADLVRENRSLRASLDVANKQAQANPLLLGLAQVSAEAAGALATALNGAGVGATGCGKQQPPGKKRKRSAAGKTLACLVLMCGFFFGSPGVIGDGDRTEPNLPAVWSNGKGKVLAPSTASRVITPATRAQAPPVRPELCLRSLKELPPPELAGRTDDPKVHVKAEPEVQTKMQHAHVKREVGLEPAVKKRRSPSPEQFSYVMCRDTKQAVDHVAECQRKLQDGKECGPPHEIKLIMPAAALRGEIDSDDDDGYAEVKCSIVSVSRIASKDRNQVVSGVTAAHMAMQKGVDVNIAPPQPHVVLPVSQ